MTIRTTALMTFFLGIFYNDDGHPHHGTWHPHENTHGFFITIFPMRMTIRALEHGIHTLAQMTLLWQLHSEHDHPHHRTWPAPQLLLMFYNEDGHPHHSTHDMYMALTQCKWPSAP